MNTTFAHIYAFPPHSDKGRKVTFTVQRDPNEELKYAFTGPPADWYLVVEKGKTETGTEYVFIEELKEKLLSLYPAEYAADKPPKLYAELVHNAWDRGYHGHLDAWTGEVGQQDYFELPDLAAW